MCRRSPPLTRSSATTDMTHVELPPASARYLAEHASIIYLLTDANGTIQRTNPCTRTLFGKQIIGADVTTLFLCFDQPPIDIATLRQHPNNPVLLSVSSDAGLPESFLFHFVPIDNHTLILGSTDILANRRLQQELLTLNGQMSGLTRELQKKNHQLAELNQIKNRFLGMAAHDLRKPVSAILAYSEFLLDEAGPHLNDEHRGFLQIVHDATEMMRRLVDDCLDVSLIESGQFPLHLRTVDFREAIRRSLELQRIIAGKRAITLHVTMPEKPAILTIDQHKIEQVINNLVGNAIEHSPAQAGIRISVEDQAGGLLMTIADDGPGMRDEDLQRLFTPFARGRAGKADGSRSTGLGLAISKQIITAHGGAIWAESHPGQGARFHFSLPKKPVIQENQL